MGVGVCAVRGRGYLAVPLGGVGIELPGETAEFNGSAYREVEVVETHDLSAVMLLRDSVVGTADTCARDGSLVRIRVDSVRSCTAIVLFGDSCVTAQGYYYYPVAPSFATVGLRVANSKDGSLHGHAIACMPDKHGGKRCRGVLRGNDGHDWTWERGGRCR